MNIQACIFDLDGTLSVEKRIIPWPVQETIRNMQRHGILCTVDTGNAFIQYIRKFGGQFTPNAPLILENGSRICDMWESYLVSPALEPEIIDAIPWIIEHNEVNLIGFYPGLYDNYLFYSEVGYIPEALYHTTFARYVTYADLLRHMHDFSPSRLVLSITNDYLQLPEGFVGSVFSNLGVYEITPQGVDKQWGVKKWSELMNIPLENIAVFGNGHNDIPLLSSPVGMKVYVGNECEPLADLATHRVDSAYDLEDFLAQEILLSKKKG